TIEELVREIEIGEGNNSAAIEYEAFSLISEDDRRQLPEGIVDAYPLTRLQAGMVFHSEFSPNTSIYRDIYSFQIRAHFDEGAMRETIRKLINRHQVLRTSFDLTNFSEPLQLVYQEIKDPLRADTLEHLSPEEQERFLETLLEEEKSKHFDWDEAPLL